MFQSRVRSGRIGRWTAGIVLATVTAVAAGQSIEIGVSDKVELDEPSVRDGRLVFPEDGAIPRSLTRTEREYIEEQPLTLLRSATPPPIGPVRTVAEYEPVEAILMSYRGPGSWKDILDEMAFYITTQGDADVHVVVPNQAGVNEVNQFMINIAGADPERVQIFVQPTDTIWVRDFGPRYVFEGDVRAVIDHTYNRPRPLDDALPSYIANVQNQPYYKLPLVHGGGNYHLDAVGGGYTTRLINNENPDLSESEIFDIWQTFQNLATIFYDPFPTFVDATQHLDMWMQVIADDKVVISEWPLAPNSTQAGICNFAAADFESRGFTVYRVPALNSFGTHYNFTNVVMVNDIVLVPQFTNATAAQYNSAALAVWEQALPEKTIIPINAQAVVTADGILHCITKHIPAPKNGEIPSAFVRLPAGGEVFDPGDFVQILWNSDDDQGVVSVDLLLSTDGGGTFDTVIAEDIADDGSFSWTAPDLFTEQAVIRVVVFDDDGNSGFADTLGPFTINGDPVVEVLGDLNGDGVVNVFDLLLLLENWGSCAGCDADLNGDGMVNVFDLLLLLENWG